MEILNWLMELFMGDFLLVHPLLMGALGIGSAIIQFMKGRIENGFSRLLLGMWFTWVFFTPDIDAVTQRVVGRWVVASLLFVEILGFIIYRYFRKRYRNAILCAAEEE